MLGCLGVCKLSFTYFTTPTAGLVSYLTSGPRDHWYLQAYRIGCGTSIEGVFPCPETLRCVLFNVQGPLRVLTLKYIRSEARVDFWSVV